MANSLGEGTVHAIETFEIPSGREPDVGSSPSSRRSEGPMHDVEILEMSQSEGLI